MTDEPYVQLLDLACGVGFGTRMIADADPATRVIGVDLSPTAVHYANIHHKVVNAQYLAGDALPRHKLQPARAVGIQVPPPPRVQHHRPLAGGQHQRQRQHQQQAQRVFGVVHLTPSPDASPFVVVGQAVKAGETLCVIEAMKVFNNICAERNGVVDAVMATSGSEVEAGQLLMRIA